MNNVSVLFVCMGNICRSPTADGVLQHSLQQAGIQSQVQVDSAGTHAYHLGEEPDQRSQQVASSRGYDLSAIRSRKVVDNDFKVFDYILAMDSDNLRLLRQQCPIKWQHKLHLFLEFTDIADKLGHIDVPDPYYEGTKGFEYVLDLIEEGIGQLLAKLRQQHTL